MNYEKNYLGLRHTSYLDAIAPAEEWEGNIIPPDEKCLNLTNLSLNDFVAAAAVAATDHRKIGFMLNADIETGRCWAEPSKSCGAAFGFLGYPEDYFGEYFDVYTMMYSISTSEFRRQVLMHNYPLHNNDFHFRSLMLKDHDFNTTLRKHVNS